MKRIHGFLDSEWYNIPWIQLKWENQAINLNFMMGNNRYLRDATLPVCRLSVDKTCVQGHHHHYMSSVVNRSALLDLHRSQFCATLIQSLHDVFVPSFMLSVYTVLGLPRPLLSFILPSSSNRCTRSPLIICQKYWHFLFFDSI